MAGWRELARNLGTGSKEGKGKREGKGKGNQRVPFMATLK